MGKSGGRLVVDALVENGVTQIFAVPGESYLPVLDALHDVPQIRLTIARQEGGAAMMADAHAKLTGRPGICLVTRGPGAANAYAGVHVAAQDSTPMILLMGQVARGDTGREAFQEVDVKAMFGDQVKWAAEVNQTKRLPEYLARAFSVAQSGRPGPVVLALPEDILSGTADVAAAPASRAVSAHPDPGAVKRFGDLLGAAERPLVIAGGPGWDAELVDRFVAFAERWALPVCCAFRAQDRFPNTHANYAGDAGLGINPALADAIRDSDLAVALGARLGDCTTSGYTLFDVPVPKQTLVHIHPEPDELGHVFQPALPIAASVGAFLAAADALEAPSRPTWKGWTVDINAAYRDWTDQATAMPGAVNLGEVIIWLRENLADDAIITNGAGNYAAWLHRFYRHSAYRTQMAPTSGSMGYGLPAAVAAKLAAPDRTVIALAGDGCLQMTIQELGTVAQEELGIIVLVVNNSMYGTIRMHQEMHYPGRVSGTSLANPDFVALARAYGLEAERVTETGQFAPAMQRALASNRASLIEIVTDPRALSPTRSLD
ncbi:MAG: thiamine pyrophosphate-binding protein [Roseitalea sp.]|jgi:acetolactate synthase-1/2/3 large subunit|nr:thiamine pyrophosphate-binding protein [Roseitalea sp.]MBO6723392.1 thiamine pyrophosphate-binding protein [Roseitalea sp.]MBO6744794.1 thiamine pyrophosphate-binding protein [Roseitalea sp.]